MRLKIDFRSGSRENYKEFCEKHPNVDLSFLQFESIIRTYNTELVKYVQETGFIIQLPFGLGSFGIIKYKPLVSKNRLGGKKIDFHNTKKLGKVVYHLNHHTEGYNFYFYWSPFYKTRNNFNRRMSYIKYPLIWSFNIARDHSRHLAKCLKEDKTLGKKFSTSKSKNNTNV